MATPILPKPKLQARAQMLRHERTLGQSSASLFRTESLNRHPKSVSKVDTMAFTLS